jgi:lauroyl/myristoyl acyltransferase
LDKGKGYELNVKPVNILSSTGRVEDDVALMNQAIEQLVKTKPEQYLWNYKEHWYYFDREIRVVF